MKYHDTVVYTAGTHRCHHKVKPIRLLTYQMAALWTAVYGMRPHRDHTPCAWRLCRPSYIKLLLLLSLYVSRHGLFTNSFRIIMAADHLVWLARPSRKHPEARKGPDHPQKTRKCRFNSFCVVVTVVNRIKAVLFAKPIFQELHEPRKCLNCANGPKSACVMDKLTHKPNV